MRKALSIETRQPKSGKEQNSTLPSNWIRKCLKDLGDFSKGKGILKEQTIEKGLPCIRYGEIYTSHDFIIKEFKSFISKDVAKECTEIRKGDILFAGSGETIEEIGKSVAYTGNEKAYAGGDIIILSTNSDVNAEYLSYALETDEVRKQKRRYGQGQQVVHIYSSDLAKVKVGLPPFPEQGNIADILNTCSAAIWTTQKLIAQLQQRNEWLTRQLLTGGRRIKTFVKSNQLHKTSLGELPTDWKLSQLKNILNPIRNPLTPKLDKLYQQIGIRSHAKGLFYKEKVTGASLGEKRVFWIEPNCFIVNIVFAWEHAIAKTTQKEEGMIASHRFPMYKPREAVLDLDYLVHFFKSARGKHLLDLASPGGAGRNKTLGQTEFINLNIPLPPFEEQIAIARAISEFEKEIQLLTAKLEQLKKQKRGLMQKLLTGKIRVI